MTENKLISTSALKSSSVCHYLRNLPNSDVQCTICPITFTSDRNNQAMATHIREAHNMSLDNNLFSFQTTKNKHVYVCTICEFTYRQPIDQTSTYSLIKDHMSNTHELNEEKFKETKQWLREVDLYHDSRVNHDFET